MADLTTYLMLQIYKKNYFDDHFMHLILFNSSTTKMYLLFLKNIEIRYVMESTCIVACVTENNVFFFYCE